MPLYRFYRIFSPLGVEQYIGCTKQPLSTRWSNHITSYQRGDSTCSSRHLFQRYGVDCCQIALIEERELATTQEARQMERMLVDTIKYKVNKYRPFVSKEEHLREWKQEYQTRKEYYKQMYQANREAIKERNLTHYHANKERIKQRLHRHDTCPNCRTEVKHYRLKAHLKSCSIPVPVPSPSPSPA